MYKQRNKDIEPSFSMEIQSIQRGQKTDPRQVVVIKQSILEGAEFKPQQVRYSRWKKV